jgi:DNA polymerase III subunit epsilon
MSEAPLAFVDVEATGLDLQHDRVVEICIERWQGTSLVEKLDTLVNPGTRAGGAKHVHGIGAEMLQDAPEFSAVASRVGRMLSGAVFVAHGSRWDVAYIEAEMARAGQVFELPYHLDTLTLARRAFGFRSNRLASLAEALGIEHRRAHRASDDVAAMRELFWRVIRELEPATPRDLWYVRVGERAARPEVLEACRGAIGQAPVLVHYRPSGRSGEHFPFMVTAVRTDLDPPRIIGYLVPGRGRRELRSDRILAVESMQDSIKAVAPGSK